MKPLFTLIAILMVTTNAWAECVILSDNGSYEVMDGWSVSKPKTFTISNPRPCNQLIFTNKQKTSGIFPATGGVTVTATYSDGSSSEIASKKGNGTHTIDLNRKIVKSLSFEGTGTLEKTISNIKLTQATYVDAPMAGGVVVTEWNAGPSIVGDDVSASATIDWSDTEFTWELQGNTDNQFSVSFSSTGETCAYGQSTITATYHRTQPGTHSATLKIYTVSGNYTIAFNGVTDKYTPLAEKKQNDLILNNSYSPSELFKVYYIANNVEQTISDYAITPLTPEIANYVDGKIVTNYRSGEAKFQLTRSGNDSFYALEDTISFTVAASGATCNVVEGESFSLPYVDASGNENGTFSTPIELPISGCGETLSFYYCVTTNANNDHYLIPQYSPDASGDDWRDLGTRQTYNSTTPKYHSVTIDDAARRIRFKRTGENKSAQRDFNITSVTITRKQFLQATDNDEKELNNSNSLVLPTVMINNAASATFNFKWSACSDIKLTCDNNKFTVSKTEITDAQGDIDITVSCNTSTEGTFSGTITIYSQEQVISFPVTCTVNNKWETDVISGSTSQTMLVDGTWTTDFVFPANNASTFPTEGGDFYYTISHDLGDNTHLKEGYTDKVITYENGVITAHNAGTAVLTIGHKETANNFASTQEFQCTITVKKYTPAFTWNSNNTPYYYGTNIPNIFSSTNGDCPYTIVSDNEAFAKVVDNTLYIANLNETANITVTQEENYKWNGKTEKYPITPINGNKHVPFTITNANYNLLKHSTTGSVSWSDGKVRFQQGGAGFNWDDSYYDIQFEGIPDILTFDFDADGAATGEEWFVQESSNGTDWESIENGSSTSNSGSISVTLQSSTRFLRFCYSGNLDGYISNIKVTERFQFEAMPKALDFGTNGINHGQQEEMVTFLHANAGRITEAVISGADAVYFSVNPTTIPGTGRDQYGTTTLKVTFDNKGQKRGTNPYNATLTIKDNAGRQIDIPLTGVRDGKSTPVFVWNPNALPYYFSTTIANVAYSSNTDYTKCPLTFTSSNESIAKVVDGDLIIYSTGQEVTITVSQAGNDDYVAHTESFTFTPCERPSLEVPFRVDYSRHATSVQLGTKCKWGDNSQIVIADYLLDGFLWGDERKRAVITFAGQPDKLYFEYRSSDAATPELAQYGWEVEESPNGIDWTTAWETGSLSASWKASGEIALKPTTQYVRISYSGNFAGYLRNITISSFEGHNYLRAEEGTYLSRGAQYGTQAVVDPFGVACRVSRYTTDNVNIYTRFQFVDNMQYLWETHDTKELFTDDATAANTNNRWQIPDASGKFYIQSGNDLGNKGQYVTIVDNALTFTSEQTAATIWHMETAEEHDIVLKDYMDKAAAMAAEKDFGASVNTLDKVRSTIEQQDFEVTEIEVPTVTLAEHSGEYRDGINGTLPAYDNTISNLEPGFYRLTVKALYRISASEYAQAAREKNLESVVAYVYANDVKYPIQSVYTSYNASSYESSDELYNGYYYPTQLTSADKAFDDANRYLNDVYVYVNADEGKTTGTLHYGIKNPSYVPGAWLAYEQITLTLFKRKEFIFQGTDATQPTNWTVAENWNTNTVPDHRHIAIIQADVEIDTEASAYEIILDTKTTPDVTATIMPNGGLTVGAGGITGATTDNFTIKAETTGTNKGQTGYIRISPHTDQPMPYATMELYSKAYYDMEADDRNNVGSWQYIGSPMAKKDSELAKTIFTSSWIYDWNEKTAEWENNRRNLILQPFEGYCTSQYKSPDGILISNTGQLASNGNVELQLTYSGSGEQRCNVFANSYAAPIDITEFVQSDFSEGVEATIYLFNTGSRNDIANQEGQTDLDLDAPGQYISIPIATAANLVSTYGYPSVIPAMQGFFVNTTQAGTLKLDYERLVWSADYTQHPNVPLRIKAQRENDEQTDTTIVVEPRPIITGALRVTIEANGWKDNLFMLESDSYDANYENGFDARKMMNGNLNIFAVEEYDTYLSVDATHSLINTYIGVRAGTDTTYTFTFSHLRAENNIALLDNETEQTIQISEGMTYTFSLTPNTTVTDRFVIVEGEKSEINTNINTITSPTKVHKFIKDNQLFILKNGVLYNAQGQLVSTNVQ